MNILIFTFNKFSIQYKKLYCKLDFPIRVTDFSILGMYSDPKWGILRLFLLFVDYRVVGIKSLLYCKKRVCVG